MSVKIFEYAVVYQPTAQEIKDGKTAKLVVEPTVLLATTEQEAMFKAGREVPPEYADKFAQLTVAVRPF